jgi:predicted dehydrogenase
MTTNPPRPTRRAFLAAAGGAAVFSIVPRHVLGGPGYVAPGDKVNIAFIGVGSQGLRVLLEFLPESDVQAVAVCDPNTQSGDYPQWGKGEFRNAVRRVLGTSSGWEWLSPDQAIALTPTLQGWGGVSGRAPCRKIIDAYNGTRHRSGESRGCAAYADFRELLDKEKDVDAVVVGAHDALHAAIAIAAMRKGKHVFCQKPMAHTVGEARRMAEVARQTGVATQVAVGNQASEDTRLLTEWIAAGAIGSVRKVVNWSSRPFWAQGIDRPNETQPVPQGFDWNLWLGPAPERPFHHIYLPFVWRGWYDFGSGALGDMGCYSFDTIFRALKLGAPTSVEATTTDRHDETFPAASTVNLHFPARGALPAVELTWLDGGRKPPRPAELDGDRGLDAEGLMFVGDRGTILCGFTGTKPRLIPAAKMAAFPRPPRTLPRSPGNIREWLDACKGGRTRPGACFEFSGIVTESLGLGNLAARTGQRLSWDPAALKVTGVEGSDALLSPKRREGWAM